MTTLHFTAQLLSDAVISERGATTGGHRSLDYIPGATLLGAVAGKLYNDGFSDSFTVFHSGKVRFGNAYPLTPQGAPTLPVPLCWHAAKGEDVKDVRGIKNLIHADKDKFDEWDNKGEQQKQLRSGFFSPQGEKLEPGRTYRLKTAINREKQGTADDAQLFGYQSLAGGSLWYFSISCDSDVSQEVLNSVSSALTSGSIRVGRSRSAEYGLLAVTRAEVSYPHSSPAPCGRLLLYCASDLALTDPVSGAAVLIPSAGHFGLCGAELNELKSYLRIRSYAPFNATRRRFDLERQVIARGSVLVFEKKGGEFSRDEMEAVQRRINNGIGLYRQDGLGQLLVNPAFLTDFSFKGFDAPLYPLQPAAAPSAPPALAAWLTEKLDEQAEEQKTVKQIDEWVGELVNGPCPKNSQWGQLRTIAVQEKSLDDIRAKITRLCSEGVSQKQWDKKVKGTAIKKTYREFLLETVLDASLELVRKRLYLLGNRLPRKNNQSNGGER